MAKSGLHYQIIGYIKSIQEPQKAKILNMWLNTLCSRWYYLNLPTCPSGQRVSQDEKQSRQIFMVKRFKWICRFKCKNL